VAHPFREEIRTQLLELARAVTSRQTTSVAGRDAAGAQQRRWASRWKIRTFAVHRRDADQFRRRVGEQIRRVQRRMARTAVVGRGGVPVPDQELAVPSEEQLRGAFSDDRVARRTSECALAYLDHRPEALLGRGEARTVSSSSLARRCASLSTATGCARADRASEPKARTAARSETANAPAGSNAR